MSEESNYHVGHLALFSEIYTGGAIYSTSAPPQIPSQASASGRPKQRRRRKKAKTESSGMNGAFGKKRKLSEEQVKMLERSFGSEHKLESERKDRLAAELGLEPKQVAVWFQNRRARWKSKQLEDEYCKLRSDHDAVVLHKCRLENQLLKLKDELNEAQKEMQRLSTDITMRCNNNSPTPSSSLTIDTNNRNNNHNNNDNDVAEAPPLFHMHVGADFNFDTSNFILQEDYYIPAFDVWSSTLYPM